MRIITGALLLGFCAILFFLPPAALTLVLIFIALGTVLIEWPRLFKHNYLLGLSLLPFYPLLPCTLLILLNQSLYRPVLFLLLGTVALFDSASYVIGKQYGSHPIAPSISPGKTWQGLIGGLLVTVVTVLVIAYYARALSPVLLAIITIPLCLSAFAGDLFESWLKRRAGLKDSGSLLPGHGGLLDRFDGVFGAVFFVYAIKGYLFNAMF